jgi:hypothetical protein
MTLAEQIKSTARELLLLAELAADAELVQWERSHAPTARDDTAERAKGGHGDPTADVALDEHRLSVRDAYKAAEFCLAGAAHGARAVRADLTRALAAWHGETVD